MRVYILAAVVVLGGCGTVAAKPDVSIAPKVVTVEVSKPCVPTDVPPAPASYPDDKLTSASAPDERYLATAASNQLRKSRLLTVEPVLAGCRK